MKNLVCPLLHSLLSAHIPDILSDDDDTAKAAWEKVMATLDAKVQARMCQDPKFWHVSPERKYKLSCGAALVFCVSDLAKGTFRLVWVGDCEARVVKKSSGEVKQPRVPAAPRRGRACERLLDSTHTQPPPHVLSNPAR